MTFAEMARRDGLRFGGIMGGRPFDNSEAFEVAVEAALGAQIRSRDDVAKQLWSAITNQEWMHSEHGPRMYSYRAAGDLLAAIRGSGDYLEWYCCADSGVVSDFIREAMESTGWKTV